MVHLIPAAGCDTMAEIDLMSIGSYTELPGGNIALPQGYSSLLAPIINVSHDNDINNDGRVQNIPPENILKQRPVKVVRWRLKEQAEVDLR